MSTDLLTQLAEYGRDSREQRQSVDLAEVLAKGEAVRSLPLPEPLEPGVRTGRRWWAAVAAAVIVLLLVGGAAWLARTGDEAEPADQPTVTTSPPEESTVTTSPSEESTVTTEVSDDSVAETTSAAGAGLVAPGSWTVLATSSGSDSAGSLAGRADDVRSWPGVLDVVVIDSGAAWRDVVGLQEDCTDPDSVPCGAGLAALTVVSQMQQTAMRFESDFGMNAVTAIEAPRASFAGYVDAAIENASPVPLEFDPAGLGTEIPLAGPSVPVSGPVCDDVDVRAVIRIVVDGFEIDACTAIYDEALVLEVAGGGGTGFEIGDLLVDRAGTRSVLFDPGPFGGREVYAMAGLPLDAAIVTAGLADGSVVWQRPLAGMALFVEGSQGKLVTPFSLLDARGDEIARIDFAEGSALLTDLRIDPNAVASPPAGLPTPLELTLYDVAFAGGLPLVQAGGGIWGVVGDEDGLVRLDPGSGETSEAAPIGAVDLTATEDAVWALTAQEGTFAAVVSRIDAATGTISHTYEFPGEAAWGRRLAVAGGAVWVSYVGGIGRIDIATGAVQTVPVGGPESVWWVGEVDDALWAHRPGSTLRRVNLVTMEIETFASGEGDTDPGAVLAGDAIWVVDLEGIVSRFDLDSLASSGRVDVGGGNGWGVYADGGVWVPHGPQGTVTRIDASTGDVTDVIEVGDEVGWTVATEDAVWVQLVTPVPDGIEAPGTVARIDTESRQVTDVAETGSGGWLSVVDGAVWVLGGDTTTRILPDAS